MPDEDFQNSIRDSLKKEAHKEEEIGTFVNIDDDISNKFEVSWGIKVILEDDVDHIYGMLKGDPLTAATYFTAIQAVKSAISADKISKDAPWYHDLKSKLSLFDILSIDINKNEMEQIIRENEEDVTRDLE